MKTVLITGGAGFIGSHLAKLLLSSGFNVRILHTLSSQIHGAVPQGLEWLKDRAINYFRGSVTDRAALTSALEGVEYVVHLAAETGTGQSMYEIARYNEVNSQGMAVMFDILANSRNTSVKRIVLASSRSIYGEGAYACSACSNMDGRLFPDSRTSSQLAAHRWEPLCKRCGCELTSIATHEDDRVRPASIYAATKFAQEELVRVACEALGIGYAILRLQNVYGEGQSLNNPYTGILSIFSTRVRRGLQLTAFEDGPNSVINVGSGVATSVLEVAIGLSEVLGHKPDIRVTGEYRLGDIRHNVADITRLREVLGYTPQVSLRDGLARFCDWVLAQPLPEDLLDRANAELKDRKLMG
jgi:dTDP-L-rhamnose 4-epimerase